MRAPTSFLRLLIALGLLLAACGAPPRQPEPSPLTPAEVKPAPAPTPAPARPQVLRMPLPPPAVLDPGIATDIPTLDLLSALFEPLVALSQSGEPQAANAESWQTSSDGTRYRFTLRPHLRWSDGSPLTAHDYVWTWRRNLTPATAAPYAGLLYPIANAPEVHAAQVDPSSLEVRATDDRTLEVTLSEPDAHFLGAASAWVAMPLQGEAIQRHGADWPDPARLVGNGPYRIATWTADEEMVLEANPHYEGPHPAQVERVDLRIFPADATAEVLQAYEADRLDTTGSHFLLAGSTLDRVAADSEFSAQLVSFELASATLVVPNHRQPYLQDERVRRALGMALDRSALVAELLGEAGSPTHGLGPPDLEGRGAEPWPEEDADQARRLLAEAGYPQGEGIPPLRFTYSTSDVNDRLASYLEHHWRETLGITLEPESMDWPSFIAWLRDGTWEQEGDLYRASWMSELSDAGHYYRTLWSARSDAALLRSGWRDEQLEELLHQAAAEPDHQRRLALYEQAAEVLAREYPAIPLYRYRGHALVKPALQGFTPGPSLGLTPWTELQLVEG